VGYSFQFDEVLRKRLKILDLGKWRSTMATISKPLREGRTVLICGSSSTGKSTFCRASINRLLTDREFPRHVSESKAGVLLLDLDLARPELTPPGLIYLAHVRSTLLGSPDSHYAVIGSSQSRILRMHYLGAVDATCISNIDIIAIKDIISYCGTVRKDYPGCPVLINSSSWLLDVPYTQLSILVSTMLLSEIVYFDSSGSLKHRELLTKSMGEKCNLWGISSKVYRSAPASTIQWSYMQSYFHLVPSKREQPTWDPLALLSPNQKEMAYSGPHSMISAVVTLGERLALSSVAQALEDSIVAIVVVRNEESYRTQADQLQGESPMPFSSDLATIVPDMLGEQQANPACIVRSEVENLPYLQDTDLESNFLDPKWSECLGLAYITAIDPEREVIEIVTPIPEQIVSDRRDNGHRLVIVMGRQNRRWAPVH
jgi:polynucleotide 5'-hydroxyl-kinase GRC3/NOL9